MLQDNYLFITGRLKGNMCACSNGCHGEVLLPVELIITADGENIAPVPIEDCIKEQLRIISNVMVIGDQKKYLSCLLTLKVRGKH